MSKPETFLNPETMTYLHILYDNNQVNAFEIHLADNTDLTHFNRIDPELELTLKFTGLTRDSAFNGNAIFSFEKVELGGKSKKTSSTDKDKEKLDALKEENKNLKDELKGIKDASSHSDEDLAKATSEVAKLTKENEELLKQIEDLKQQVTSSNVKTTDASSTTTEFENNKTPAPKSK